MRAFLGRIDSAIRLIKISLRNEEICLVIVCYSELTPEAKEDISCAEAEIMADFPDICFKREIEVSATSLPNEDCVASGWIYLAREKG